MLDRAAQLVGLMEQTMRQMLLVLFAFAVLGDGISPATAQTWPERPVTMVIPFPPGGGTDLLGRIVAKGLTEVLGQQVVVENVGGAGGMLGSARVVKSAPDGYTMVIGTTADAINQTLYKAPLYNFATDLVPAGLMGNQPTVLLARRTFPPTRCRNSLPMSEQTGRRCSSARRASARPAICFASCSMRRSASTT
jgi:tripartite-type tricarboxylate transporter receptor subunit TctC